MSVAPEFFPLILENLSAAGLDERVSGMRGLHLIEPVGYLDFLKLMSNAAVVLTDSGGIQEEATGLKIPALVLRQVSDDHRDWRLPEVNGELNLIARNERRFLGFSEDDSGFDPSHHAGKVVVTTYHKAKGLEWDRVYLMSVNNYDFPSGDPHDSYIAERWFVRNGLNLQEEALAQLTDLMVPDQPYDEGGATITARHDYVAERLRLLYVGITRAKRELVVTSNTGRSSKRAVPAVPFIVLRTYWEQRND